MRIANTAKLTAEIAKFYVKISPKHSHPVYSQIYAQAPCVAVQSRTQAAPVQAIQLSALEWNAHNVCLPACLSILSAADSD